jgi:hypothetical protein
MACALAIARLAIESVFFDRVGRTGALTLRVFFGLRVFDLRIKPAPNPSI